MSARLKFPPRKPGTRLAPELAVITAIKVAAMAAIWVGVVRHHAVPVDAGSAAAAFGLAGPPPIVEARTQGAIDGK